MTCWHVTCCMRVTLTWRRTPTSGAPSNALLHGPSLAMEGASRIGSRCADHNAHDIPLGPSPNGVVIPIQQNKHDWMHALLVHGGPNTATYLNWES